MARTSLRAQESGIVRGIVVEQGASTRIGNASIVNKTTHRSTNSSYTGDFEISATVGDSISISKMGYQTVTTVINTLSDILIDLKKGSIRIEEVTIQRMSKEAEMQDAMRSYRKQGVYYEGKPSTLQYIFTPITALYERFGRTPQNARRFRNYMGRELAETQIDKLFNRTRITNLTGLEGEDLNNFMKMYRPDPEVAYEWGEYDVTLHIQNSFKHFDKAGRPAFQKLPKIEIPPQVK